jgi:hypothetical protein
MAQLCAVSPTTSAHATMTVPTPSTTHPHSPPREHFLPLRKRDLISLLACDSRLDERQREQFLALCRLLDSTFHFEYHRQLESLKDAYAPFDPDAETAAVIPHSPEGRQAVLDALCRQLAELLERANFQRLSREQLEQALRAASNGGVNLHVDFDVFDRLEVYSRGDSLSRRTFRRWRRLWRPESREVRVYQRLVVLFRLREDAQRPAQADSQTVYLKLFKNIPHDDVEMLLPGCRVRMTLFDQAKIWLPTLTGLIVTLIKIAKGALLLAFAGMYGLLGFLGLVGGTIGYGVKSFLGFLRTKDKHQLNLTRSLYYGNLDNNAGVLCRLLDEAEEQELRETVLAYFLLWREAPPRGWTQDELDRAAEAWLAAVARLSVDFETDDAAAKLLRLGIADEDAAGRLRAVEIGEALQRLDRTWDRFFEYSPPQPLRRAA